MLMPSISGFLFGGLGGGSDLELLDSPVRLAG